MKGMRKLSGTMLMNKSKTNMELKITLLATFRVVIDSDKNHQWMSNLVSENLIRTECLCSLKVSPQKTLVNCTT